MKQITINPNNEPYYSEDFIKGFKCGAQRQFEADKADRPQGEWIDAEIPLESGDTMPIQVCSLCKTFYPLAYTGGGHRFCPNCGARMLVKDINVPNKKGADDEQQTFRNSR